MAEPKQDVPVSANDMSLRRHSFGTLADNSVNFEINLKALSTKETQEETYSIQTAIDALGFKWFQVKLSLVTGMCLLAESMEIMMISILGPILRCDMMIPTWTQALLSMLVMGGMLLSSGPWGAMADRYGRKKALIVSTLGGGYFSILTSLSPNFEWVAINRFLVGTCVGSFPQTVTFFSEFLPTKTRTGAIISIELFFSCGAAIEIAIAKLVMPTLGWRYMLAITAIPVLLFALFAYWMPESPHYLLSRGHYNETVQVLERIALANGRSLPPGKLKRVEEDQLTEVQTSEGVLSPKYRRPTFLLMMICFVTGVGYYGLALLLPTLLVYPDGCHGSDVVKRAKDSCLASCQAFTQEDYNDLLITGLADLPGLLIAFFFFSFLERRSAFAVCLILFSSAMLACNICMPRNQLTAMIFIARAMSNGIGQSVYILLTETFPTHIRGSAVGLGTGMTRVGAIVAPLITQVGTMYSAFFSITFLGALGLTNVIYTSLLPPFGPGINPHGQETPAKSEEGPSEYQRKDRIAKQGSSH